ncbi:MAG: DUF3656 domain-containing protein [Anaeromyxobacter sp.]
MKLRYRLDRPNLATQRARRGVRLDALVGEDGVRLTASVEAAPGRALRAEAHLAGPLDPAGDPERLAATARKALEKVGDTRFRLEALAWENPQARFVPVSRLNEARREVLAALDRALAEDATARAAAARAELRPAPVAAPAPAPAPRWILKVGALAALDAFAPEDLSAADELVLDLSREPARDLVPRLDALAARAGGRGRLRLGLPLILRAWEEKALRARLDALRAAGFARFELTNAASWTLLGLSPGQTDGLDLSSDWSLYAVNRGAARQLRELGLSRVTLSTEDVRRNLAAMVRELGQAAAVVVYEDSPLFISESCPYANLRGGCPGPAACSFEQLELTSSHGGQVTVVNDRCRSFTLGDAPFNLSPRFQALLGLGVSTFRAHLVHRPYAPAEALALWRALRRLEVVTPGHTGSFDRPGW